VAAIIRGRVASLERAAAMDDLACAPSDRLLYGISPAGATPCLFMSLRQSPTHLAAGRNFGTAISSVVVRGNRPLMRPALGLLPMLSLCVPGSPTAAVRLGGLLLWGLQPGAAVVRRPRDFSRWA